MVLVRSIGIVLCAALLSSPSSAEGILAPDAADPQADTEIRPLPKSLDQGAGTGNLQVRLSCGLAAPLLSSDLFTPAPFDGLLRDSAALAPSLGEGPVWTPRPTAAPAATPLF